MFGKEREMCPVIMSLCVQLTVSLSCLQHNDLFYFLMILESRFGNLTMAFADASIKEGKSFVLFCCQPLSSGHAIPFLSWE